MKTPAEESKNPPGQEEEEEEEQDLRELKAKLKVLQDTKPPEDKDELIKYLVERLSQAEQAIVAAEQCIEGERSNRKKVSKDIKAKNFELREIVNKEKKTLQDKVHQELEETLSAALQGKIEAENKLKEATDKIEEHTRLFEEMDAEIRRLLSLIHI